MLTVVVGVVTFSVAGFMNTCHHSSCTSGTGRPNFTALFVCCRWHTALQISLTVAGYCSVSTHAGTPPGDALVTALTVGAIALYWQVSLSWSEVSLHVAISQPSNTTRSGRSILSIITIIYKLNHVYPLPYQHNQSADHSVDILCDFLTLWNFNLRYWPYVGGGVY